MISMGHDVAKALRTVQNWFPFLKPLKDEFYLRSRRLLRKPHDRDFNVLRMMDDAPVLLDIGANQGQSIESMRLLKPASKIVAFEPNPNLAAALSARYRTSPSVRIEPVGLGERPGSFELYVPIYNGFVYDGLASFNQEEAKNWLPDRIFGFDPGKLRVERIQCRVETLDSFKLEPTFVKIDVQGHEENVLRGGQETLRRSRPILLVEAPPERLARWLSDEFGYKSYSFDGGRLREGAGDVNSILVPEGSWKVGGTLMRSEATGKF